MAVQEPAATESSASRCRTIRARNGREKLQQNFNAGITWARETNLLHVMRTQQTLPVECFTP
jgi:hypothetical protein